MEAQAVIGDVETLTAIADPLRMRLLMLLASPHTVKQAAAGLGVPPTRLYYHLQILEDHGLIEVVRRRKVSGIEERTYQGVARSWNVSPELAAGSLESAGVLAAMLNLVHAEMAVALDEHPGPIGDGGGPFAFSLVPLAFTPQQLREFTERLFDLLEEYVCVKDRAPAGANLHHFLVAGYPVSPPGGADAARD